MGNINSGGKRALIAGTILLGWAYVAYGQGMRIDPCAKVVVGSDGVLKTSENERVVKAAQTVNAEGAETHVVIAEGKIENLDVMVNQWVKECPSWQAINGGPKSTLIVAGLAPDTRKMGIYYGSQWKKALDSHSTRIRMDFMAPSFRQGEWAIGLTLGLEQIAKRLAAAKDEALHPAVSTTTYAAVDYTGLWHFGYLLLILGSLGGLAWGIHYLLSRRQTSEEDTHNAQMSAIMARSSTIHLINALRDKLEETPNKIAQLRYDALMEEYSEFAASEKGNPNTDGLTKGNYEAIEEKYESFRSDIRAITASLDGVVVKAAPGPSPAPKSATIPSHSSRSPKHKTVAASGGSSAGPGYTRAAQPDYYPPTQIYTPVVLPVIVDEEVVHEHHHEDAPVEYPTSRQDDSPSFTSDSSSYDSSSSDSSSSSSSDSFSSDSSSFDSGSSFSDSSSSFSSDSSGF